MPPPPPLCRLLGRLHRRPPITQPRRTFVDARVKWVRDRALDHAVEKEKHLQPFHALKDLLLFPSSAASSSPPGPSLPLAFIASRAADLRLPFRAIRFIRLFPSAFIEELPPPAAGATPRPVIRPTTALLSLHDDERRAFEATRPDAADRLLRLLMLSRRRRLPLCLVDRLRWDLGLPRDYARSLLPDYPDYFQIVPSTTGVGGALDLELVLYRKDLAVSAMERYAMKTGGYNKGMSLAFPLYFSRGFDLEKKVRKWLDEWQKLPYISPYEDASNLAPKSDLAEKWMVAMLHEVLHLFVPKKTEKENLVLLGEHLGLPPGFRKVITHHPGIFYVSSKLKTQTVVLREAYRRDLLLGKHPLMGLRYQYIHLMHKGKETDAKEKHSKSRRVAAHGSIDNDITAEDEEGEEEDDDDEEEEELSAASGIDTEDESDDENVRAYKYVSELWRKKQSDVMRFLQRVRCWEYRQLPSIVRVTRPTRPDKARRLGYKAKQGYVIYRVRVRRGGRKRPVPKGIVYGKPKHQGITQLKFQRNKRSVAEERAGRKLGGLRVVNSYWVNEDSTYKYYEIILIDPAHSAIRNDPRINWICKGVHKHRELRGLTSAGKKYRGLRGKGHLHHKARPSRRATWKRNQTLSLRRYR
ncbi:Plant organelle RNA recognition domain [Musa troglodytarum]|nr:Plant organelle RNA recognition domain [Musa troglodytarum]